jgi:hypothetical protein
VPWRCWGLSAGSLIGERGNILSKIGPIALATALILLGGLGYAADKITLACSTADLDLKFPEFGKKPGSPLSMVIDLDRGVVSMPAGEAAITKVTEHTIGFDGKHEKFAWSGSIDRISGAGFMMVSVNGQPQFSTELACKPAKALF